MDKRIVIATVTERVTETDTETQTSTGERAGWTVFSHGYS